MGTSSMSLAARAEELTRARVPFVSATVVRAVHPTSAHAGDTALVHADGEIEGFVGGTCAESSVRLHALQVLVTGEPLLLRVQSGAAATTVEEGVVTVANPCVSGGTIEIFLEPRRPAPRLLVVGSTPVAQALAALGTPLGYTVETGPELGSCDDAAAVVVASHGRKEEPALEAAVRAGVPYVGLVASRTRAAAVLGSLDVDTSAVHSPAGLDIGGRTAAEIALSILAEIVATRPPPDTRDGAAEVAAAVARDAVTPAVDPVCGMTVAVSAATPRAEVDGVLHHFCCEPCRVAYVADPERYATV
jgi:xanthine dehydrogenase accessory factor